MTTVLLAIGSLLAAVGTRFAAVAFAAASVPAFLTSGRTSAIGPWGALTGAGVALLGGSVRRSALPGLGLALVLVAAASTNGSVVLAPWTLASVATVLSFADHPRRWRWATALFAGDLCVAAAVVVASARSGFVSWPLDLGVVAATLLGIGALVRLPVASTEGAEAAGLVVVRVQVAVLAVLAIPQALPEIALAGVVAVAGLLFAMAPLSLDARRMDVVQEASLIAAAIAVDELGWLPRGWLWGAIAAGSLIHLLRLRVAARREPDLMSLLITAGGVGVPFLPVVAAVAAAALRAGSWVAAPFVVAAVVGARGRATAGPSRRGRPGGGPPVLGRWVGASAAAGIVAIGVCGPLLTVPHWRAGGRVPWPPLWAAALVVGAGAIGSFVPRLALSPQSRPRRPPGRYPLVEAVRARLVRGVYLLENRYVVMSSAAGVLIVAVVLWVLGWARGFL